MSNLVTYEVRGNVALITLNRPDARNAVNDELAADMEACIDRLEADDTVWVGVLTANTEGHKSPVFCAGADLKALSAGGQSLGTKRGGFAGYVYRERVSQSLRLLMVLLLRVAARLFSRLTWLLPLLDRRLVSQK